MSRYHEVQERLREEPRSWLITGVAGFIGSNLLEKLLLLNQRVIGLDNFSTGHARNLDQVLARIDSTGGFRFIEGDIRDLETCRSACAGVDIVLHQAALGSVPRSIADPLATHASNVDGFLNMLVAARDANLQRFVYAASSSTYGDHPALPKVESAIGRPLSPYAVTKYVNELYASVFQRTYGIRTVGLRYFNVFGKYQDPEGPYAAVIPKWIAYLLGRGPCRIYGDGETSRDFCYVENAVQANLLAATCGEETTDEVYNVAYGERTTLNQLYELIRSTLTRYVGDLGQLEPVHEDFRAGDVRHSQADISKITERLGYEPSHSVVEGLEDAIQWYVERSGSPWISVENVPPMVRVSAGITRDPETPQRHPAHR